MSSMTSLRRLFFSFVLTILLIEGFAFASLSAPFLLKRYPEGIVGFFKKIYMKFDRKIVQFDPDMSQYDPGLFYTLKPGQFALTSREFRSRYEINSLGVRDDADSLVSPQIVVLGDSFAMGWGVDQKETFSEIIQKNTSQKVLNAAVSSYGTAREMKMLDRIDTSNLKYLIIQYCDNDYEENEEFRRNHNQLPIGTLDEYLEVRRQYLRNRRYYFGRYSMELLKDITLRILISINQYPDLQKFESPKRNEADLFLNVLINGRQTDLSKTKIIVFSMNAYLGNDRDFIGGLKKKLKSGNFPPYVRDMECVDVDSSLNLKEHGYLLDDHINARGHQVVAHILLRLMRGEKK